MTEYIDLKPTTEGYKSILRLFKEAVQTYQSKIDKLNAWLNDSNESYVDFELLALLEEAVNMLIANKQESVDTLNKSINEIETYLAFI